MINKLNMRQQSELIQIQEDGDLTYHPELIQTLKSFDLLKTTRKEIQLFDNSDDINGITPVKPVFHAHIFESKELLNGKSSLALYDDERSLNDSRDNYNKKYITQLKFNKDLYLTSVIINEATLTRLQREFCDDISNTSFLGGGYFCPIKSTINDLISSLTNATEVFGYGNGVRAFGTSTEISRILQDFKYKKVLQIKKDNDSLFLMK